jgi:rfaE bifunctional protein kinase chain/domain
MKPASPILPPPRRGPFSHLRMAVVGDFCLDQYWEIDPDLPEVSIETGRPVRNVVGIRHQPGAAGTILNNLVALGVGTLHPIGLTGADAHGWALRQALMPLPGVHLSGLLEAPDRHTFTYTKPLLLHPGQDPEELDRLDVKNRTPTPLRHRQSLAACIRQIVPECDAVIVLDQVDIRGTGVVTPPVLKALDETRPARILIGDSRRGFCGWPRMSLKMNQAELSAWFGRPHPTADTIAQSARQLSRRNRSPIFVTLADQGIVGAQPDGQTVHVPSFPVEGAIDVVGAGDSVTANLACALAAGASLQEAMTQAMAAASLVVHQLGTTGFAFPEEIQARRVPGSSAREILRRRSPKGPRRA